MNVFGLEPVTGAILITILGVSGSVLLGWLKGVTPINPRQIVSSAIIAFVISYQLVGATLNAIPSGIDSIAYSMIIIGLIGQVAGIDSLTKSAVKAAIKKRV